MLTERDEFLLRRALTLARNGVGLTRPNPPVGAVLADAHGRVLAENWHRGAGLPHAEALAIEAAGARARGGTLAVTLEPCCTWGRTPPCADRIIEAGLRRVVVGAIDPNPLHRGKGLRRLRRAGIEVIYRTKYAPDATALMAPFDRWVRTGRPWLTLKLAATLDGRIADAKGASRWITGAAARRRVQALRRTADAILVGARTVRLDNPSLLPRPAAGRKPWRVIVDARGSIPPHSRVLTDAKAAHTVVATTAACPERIRAQYALHGARVWVCRARQGEVSLRDLALRLGRMGVLHVVCEGGGKLAASLIQAGWVDALEWYIAPRLLGSRAIPAIGDVSWPLATAPGFEVEAVEQLGPDVRIRCVRPSKGGD